MVYSSSSYCIYIRLYSRYRIFMRVKKIFWTINLLARWLQLCIVPFRWAYWDMDGGHTNRSHWIYQKYNIRNINIRWNKEKEELENKGRHRKVGLTHEPTMSETPLQVCTHMAESERTIDQIQILNDPLFVTSSFCVHIWNAHLMWNLCKWYRKLINTNTNTIIVWY